MYIVIFRPSLRRALHFVSVLRFIVFIYYNTNPKISTFIYLKFKSNLVQLILNQSKFVTIFKFISLHLKYEYINLWHQHTFFWWITSLLYIQHLFKFIIRMYVKHYVDVQKEMTINVLMSWLVVVLDVSRFFVFVWWIRYKIFMHKITCFLFTQKNIGRR